MVVFKIILILINIICFIFSIYLYKVYEISLFNVIIQILLLIMQILFFFIWKNLIVENELKILYNKNING